ncbi:MAG: hypothetical protein NT105_06965, partial [Verrucomicrobia bacterium]|nr:hypothetical protein [Verrucomicrobiota bacterium]
HLASIASLAPCGVSCSQILSHLYNPVVEIIHTKVFCAPAPLISGSLALYAGLLAGAHFAMRRQWRMTFMLFGVFCGGMIGYVGVALFLREREPSEMLKSVAVQALPLSQECQRIGLSKNISLRGKALIWDQVRGGISPAYYELPRHLRARPWHRLVTVFIIIPGSIEQVGAYSISKKPGYRVHVQVCVVYLPERIALGVSSAFSANPPSSRMISREEAERAYFSSGLAEPFGMQVGPAFGDVSRAIADWVVRLPRSQN